MSKDEELQDSSELDIALEQLAVKSKNSNAADTLSLCEKLESTFGPHFEICHHRAHALAIMGDRAAAIAALSTGIALQPREPALFYFRGLWQLDAGDLSNAKRDLSTAIELEAGIGSSYYLRSARFARAIASVRQGDFDQALVDCGALEGDIRVFVAGRLWSVEDVLNAIPTKLRDRKGSS